MAWVVGGTVSEISDDPIASDLTFTRTASYVGGSAVTWSPTIAEVASTGLYRCDYVPSAAGPHSWVGLASDGVSTLVLNFDVISAAADPAAIATAIAAVQTTVDGIDANVDVAVSTRATPGAYVTTGSAVATNGDVTVYQGTDHLVSNGRAIVWTSVTSADWPTLTGATITFTAGHTIEQRHVATFTGEIVTATGANKQVRLQLTAVQTAVLLDGIWDYQVTARIAGVDTPLVTGIMTVVPLVTA